MKTYRNFFIILIATVIALSFLFGHLSKISKENMQKSEVERVRSVSKEIEYLFFGNILHSLDNVAKRKRIKQSIRRHDGSLSQEILETMTNSFLDSVVYLMDSSGTVIVGTAYNAEGKTFSGNNYSFRPYFYLAQSRGDVVFPAVGVTSKKRGLYFSKGVYDDDEFLGVIVVKIELDGIDAILSREKELNLSLMTPEGVIFASAHNEYLYSYFYDIDKSVLEQIERQKQFSESPLERLGRVVEERKHLVINSVRYRYVVHDTEFAGWKILHFRPVSDYVIQRREWIAFLIISLMVLTLLVVLFFLYRLVDQKQRAETKLENYLFVIEQSPISILIAKMDGTIEYVNPYFQNLTGYTREELIGKTPAILKSGKHGHGFYAGLWDTILAGRSWTGEFYNRKKGGELYWESATIYPLKDKQGKVFKLIGIKEDITEKKQIMEQLNYYASIDEMTAILNRRTGMLFLEKQITMSAREGTTFSICYADINNLKDVNDNFGHAAGDRLIRLCSEIFKNTLRKSDTVCRLGGDEFLMIFTNSCYEDSLQLADRIKENLQAYNDESSEEFELSVSLGVTEYNRERHVQIDDLIKEADMRMYEDKQRYKKFYSKS